MKNDCFPFKRKKKDFQLFNGCFLSNFNLPALKTQDVNLGMQVFTTQIIKEKNSYCAFSTKF